MAEPYTLDDTIRIHDRAIFDWLGALKFHYPEITNPLDDSRVIAEKKNHPVIRVKASPARAFAAIVDTLVWQNWIPETDGEEMRSLASDNLAVLPLPAVSWQRSDPRPDPELSNTAFQWQKGFFNCETQRWEYYRWPKHWLTDYTITFWAKKEISKAFWLEWIMSEFGNIGAGQNETFIQIMHKEPFGTIKQRLQMVSLEDLSDLEGEEQRYTRSELTVTLRTWVTMPVLLNPPGVGGECGDGEGNSEGNDTGIGAPIYYIGVDFDVCGQQISHPTNFYQTLNLWPGLIGPWSPRAICRGWPTEGDGKIETENKRDFDIEVSETTDRVQVWGLPTDLDAIDGLSIVGFSFDYESNADVTFEVEKVDGTDPDDTPEQIYGLTLPKAKSEENFHQFFLTDETIVSSYLRGTGGAVKPQEVTIRNLDLRIIGILPKIIGTAVPAGASTRYEFTGLEGKPYLVVLRFTGTPSGPYTITLANDLTTPTYTATGEADATKNAVGIVLMNQPKTDSLVLTVDNNVAIVDVWAQPYEGYYNGHTI